MLHIACESVPALRDFIKLHLGSDPDLGRTETQIIFEQHAGKSTMPEPAGPAGSTGRPRRSDGAGGPGLR